MRQVLIAHQSTIPHYRVPFYNALEERKPNDWSFRVSFDETELTKPRFFNEGLDVDSFNFRIYPVSTFSQDFGASRISYQTMWREAGRCDLVIVENAVNNLAYPLSQLHMLRGTKVAYWGHGRDMGAENPSPMKRLSEWGKIHLSKCAAGFFAYTPGVKDFLVSKGMPSNRIFVVNNTIDINLQRVTFQKWLPKRERLRRDANLHDKKVLLFVGRVTKKKRIDFLLESFNLLNQRNRSFHLILVGDGVEVASDFSGVSCFRPSVELEILAPLYVTSDVFAFPGSTGLGPLQALCYELPVVTIASDFQMPEFEYLSNDNSIILDPSSTPRDYADAIENLFNDHQQLGAIRQKIWPSIQHLTIEAMADNFIAGINTLLDL